MCDEARESTVAPEHDDVQPASPEPTITPELEAAAVPEPAPEAVTAQEAEAAPEAALEPEAAAVPEAALEPEAAPAEPREAGEAPTEPLPAPVEVELTPEARAERMSRLAQLLDGADQVLSATDLPDARTRWNALRREWTALVAGLALDEPLASRLAAVEGRIDARDAAVREARTRHQQDNLIRLQALGDEAEKLSQGDHLTLRDAERLLRDIRTALDAPGPLPSRQDQQAIVSRL